MTARRAHHRPGLLLAAATLCAALPWSGPARASFDVVGVYHEKVKQFEAVYFLQKDAEWHRDRRIFELFGEGDWLRYDNPALAPFDTADDKGTTATIFSGSAGMLINVRPDNKSKVQLSLFNIFSNTTKPLPATAFDGATARPEGSGGAVQEALHGARLTLGDVAEASLGAYWLTNTLETWQAGVKAGESRASQGSFFFELNSPFLFSKSSYVVGKDLSGRDNEVKRFDLRLAYDQLLFVENLEAGFIRYNFTDQPNWMAAASITRIGAPQFKFLSAEVRYSLTDHELGWFRGGLDILLQADDDFNLTRRGHFGTSFGAKAFYTRATTSTFQIFNTVTPHAETVTGYELTAYCQIPAKWFWTAVMLFGAAAAQSSDSFTDAQKQQMMDTATQMLADTIEEPRDIMFTRITFTMSKNAPETYAILGEPEDRTRYFASLSFIY
ncbi:MAG: hypothetical protein HY903_23775 [Deltaproteobacteria bacterium]|nr:hypothetical protein [Deltaproteobacteria bacterium]